MKTSIRTTFSMLAAALLLAACAAEPTSSEKEAAARSYIESQELLVPEVFDIDAIAIDNTVESGEQTRKVYFTVTFKPKMDVDTYLEEAASAADADPSLVSGEDGYKIVGHNAFIKIMRSPELRSSTVASYTDFKPGQTFTKPYWVTVTKTDKGWLYLSY